MFHINRLKAYGQHLEQISKQNTHSNCISCGNMIFQCWLHIVICFILHANIFFPSISEETNLCPVRCLQAYMEKTKQHREKDSLLFRSIIKPYGRISPTTISRWLTQSIILAGGPVLRKKLKGHSVRGAATSLALDKGLSVKDIIRAGDWKQDSVFFKHYYHPTREEKFGKTVLSVKPMAPEESITRFKNTRQTDARFAR